MDDPAAAPDLRFDRVADRYDQTRGGMNRARAFARSLVPHLPDDGTVLEVGVGTGAIAAALRELHVDVVGVDLSRPMLDRALERLGPSVVIGDALRLPVADRSCAAVLFAWVLQLVDPEHAIAEAARVLAPSGRIVTVLSVPVHGAGDEIEAIVRPMHERVRPDRPVLDRLRDAADAHGLRIVHEGTTEREFWTQSPADEAQRLEERTYSSLWHLTDDVWRAEVQPAIDRLRALPDPTRPRERESAHPVVVLARP